MSANESKPVLLFSSALEWGRWLERNGSDSPGVRLRLRKKGSALPGFVYAEALDVALCFGWIDGQINAFDADYYLQVFTPRRPKSTWSKINRDHIARLTAEGRMRPAGIAEVQRAQGDGRWDAAQQNQGDASVPGDARLARDETSSPPPR